MYSNATKDFWSGFLFRKPIFADNDRYGIDFKLAFIWSSFLTVKNKQIFPYLFRMNFKRRKTNRKDDKYYGFSLFEFRLVSLLIRSKHTSVTHRAWDKSESFAHRSQLLWRLQCKQRTVQLLPTSAHERKADWSLLCPYRELWRVDASLPSVLS